jgi:uracil-DNA glycosylase
MPKSSSITQYFSPAASSANSLKRSLTEGSSSSSSNKRPAVSALENLMPNAWKSHLSLEFQQSYFTHIENTLAKEEGVVFPAYENIFRAFELTDWESLRVVILGQDPYHDVGQGLCFSVPKGIQKPSSLNNIFKELLNDGEISRIPSHGNLENWAKQGVLLLNTVLTVKAHQANSHKDIGWQRFTDKVISVINQKKSGVIFVLWGKQAQMKGKSIDGKKHFILESPHPSGLSAHRGFFGCRHFSRINQILRVRGEEPINWDTSDC